MPWSVTYVLFFVHVQCISVRLESLQPRTEVENSRRLYLISMENTRQCDLLKVVRHGDIKKLDVSFQITVKRYTNELVTHMLRTHLRCKTARY